MPTNKTACPRLCAELLRLKRQHWQFSTSFHSVLAGVYWDAVHMTVVDVDKTSGT